MLKHYIKGEVVVQYAQRGSLKERKLLNKQSFPCRSEKSERMEGRRQE